MTADPRAVQSSSRWAGVRASLQAGACPVRDTDGRAVRHVSVTFIRQRASHTGHQTGLTTGHRTGLHAFWWAGGRSGLCVNRPVRVAECRRADRSNYKKKSTVFQNSCITIHSLRVSPVSIV